jgi:hypothetical protein
MIAEVATLRELELVDLRTGRSDLECGAVRYAVRIGGRLIGKLPSRANSDAMRFPADSATNQRPRRLSGRGRR